MRFLKQSTATTVTLGPFLDSTDGFTPETGLTIAQANVRLSKNDGAFAQVNDNTSATHKEFGYYSKELDATDTNTLGHLRVAVDGDLDEDAIPVFEDFTVLAANVFDSLIGGGDTLDVQVTGMGAGVVTAAAIATDAIDDDAIATGAIASTAFAAGAITATAIASDAIAAAKIASGAITSAKFAAGAIDATAIADGAIDAATFASGAINAAAIAADAIGASELATDAVTEIVNAIYADARTGVIHTGTAAGTDVDEITLAANSFADDEIVGAIVNIRSATTGAGQSRFITDFVASTEVATISPAWTTEPTGTVVYDIIAAPPAVAGVGTVDANIVSISGDSAAADTLELFVEALDQVTGQLDSGSLASGTITATSIASSAITNAKFAAGAIDAAAIADNAIDAGAIASDAITAAKVAADVTTEIQNGLATASALSSVASDVSAILTDTGTAGVVVSQATQQAIADEVLDRDLATGSSGGARNVQSALRALRNKKTISGGTLTVFAEDDSTEAWDATVTTAAGDPISGVDPA
jgi:hypothetical protein